MTDTHHTGGEDLTGMFTGSEVNLEAASAALASRYDPSRRHYLGRPGATDVGLPGPCTSLPGLPALPGGHR